MNEQTLLNALEARRSVRAFLEREIPVEDLESILRAARSAPSGANLQPGVFHVLTGEPLNELTQNLTAAHISQRPIVSEYSYFPKVMPKSLRQKQVQAGRLLYDALGVARGNDLGRAMQSEKNYRFFDAPVGIVVSLRRDMGAGCFMDLGLALMALMLAAQDLGYGTCAIGALANYGDLVHQELGLGDDELVVCGLALGIPDLDAPVNNIKTQRDELTGFSKFYGFD